MLHTSINLNIYFIFNRLYTIVESCTLQLVAPSASVSLFSLFLLAFCHKTHLFFVMVRSSKKLEFKCILILDHEYVSISFFESLKQVVEGAYGL